MRAILMVIAVAMLAAVVAHAQPAEAPPPEAPPPVIDEAAPPAPEPPPQPQPRTQPDIIGRAISFYEQTRETPPEVGAFLARNPALGTVLYIVRYMQSVLIWLFLFLLIGLGGRKLLRPLFSARPVNVDEPRGYARGDAASAQIGRRGAAADTVAWLVALAIACEAVGLTWFGELWGGLMELAAALVGAIVWLGLLIALAALIVWSFTTHGRRLVLSVLGWYYLTRSANRPPEGHLFRLPDGREAAVVGTDVLHSKMQTEGGETATIPNADLMEQYYNWAAPDTEKAAQSPPER
ncbi:MAG: hypothetical protein ACOCX2_07065 [Armatimonadota bacterium]